MSQRQRHSISGRPSRSASPRPSRSRSSLPPCRAATGVGTFAARVREARERTADDIEAMMSSSTPTVTSSSNPAVRSRAEAQPVQPHHHAEGAPTGSGRRASIADPRPLEREPFTRSAQPACAARTRARLSVSPASRADGTRRPHQPLGAQTRRPTPRTAPSQPRRACGARSPTSGQVEGRTGRVGERQHRDPRHPRSLRRREALRVLVPSRPLRLIPTRVEMRVRVRHLGAHLKALEGQSRAAGHKPRRRRFATSVTRTTTESSHHQSARRDPAGRRGRLRHKMPPRHGQKPV